MKHLLRPLGFQLLKESEGSVKLKRRRLKRPKRSKGQWVNDVRMVGIAAKPVAVADPEGSGMPLKDGIQSGRQEEHGEDSGRWL